MTGYFERLCRIIGVGEHGLPYVQLCSWLYDHKFLVLKSGDYNRAYDGMELRDGYFDAPKGDCNVLEMLVALSKRMVFMADGMFPDIDNTESEWFLIMIQNLGISELDDKFWNRFPEDAACITEQHVDEWMNREFDYDGSGSLFPLSNPKDDQVQVEIWYQMNAYLVEKMHEKL